MDIARQKRDENIAEYVLYIWQLEDLLRALRFDPGAVYAALVGPREATDEWRREALEWYMELAGLLQREGKAEAGHLDHTLHLIGEVNDLHLMLLEQPVGRRYRELWEQLAPSLPGLRAVLGRDDVSDIELCFRSLYAAMLYRMRAGTPAAGMKAGTPSAGTKAGTPSAGAKSAAADKSGVANKSGAADKSRLADEVTALVSPVVALLADFYHRVERGEVDLYKDLP